MQDQPRNLPRAQNKSLTDVLLARRATRSFKPDPIPDDVLEAILRLGLEAPSGYNLQPWRFVVVRDTENRQKLMKCAFNQPKVGQAPVVVIAVGMKDEWKKWAEEVFREGAERRGGSRDYKKPMDGAMQFLGAQKMDVWVTRHTMIAFTALMYAAEAYGFDTAPMEGFDAALVKREFGIPDEGEVTGLLAIGKAQGEDPPYGGRFGLDRVVFREKFGEAYKK